MKKLGIFFSAAIMIAIICMPFTSNVFANQSTPIQPRSIVKNTIKSGELKALVVRIGYKDYPLNNSNKLYNLASNDFIKSAFVNDKSETGLTYSGIKEYIENSSFGKMSVTLGEIIDIQMDNNLDFYLNYDGADSEMIDYDIFSDIRKYNGPYYITDEFEKKLLMNINIDDYDSNNDGIIDALYILDTADYQYNSSGNTTYSYLHDSTISQSRVWLPLYYNANLKQVIINLIHETGHLLFNLNDYYLLNGFDTYYYPHHSIENIMASGSGDYDAVAKWHIGWLNDDNVIRIFPDDNETATVSLTPSDSDNDKGKKLAIINLKDYVYIDETDEELETYYNIAIEYISGSNNNNFTNLTKPKGFRFYLIEGELGERDISAEYSYVTRAFKTGKYDPNFLQHISYQVLDEEDAIENLFDLGIDITNIETGDDPSFTFHYTKKDNIDLSVPDLYTSADYSALFEQIARLSDDFKDIDFIPAFIPEGYYTKYTEESLNRLEDALYAQFDKYKLPEQYIVDQNTERLKAAIDGLELKKEQSEQAIDTTQNNDTTDTSSSPQSSSPNENNTEQPQHDTIPKNDDETFTKPNPQTNSGHIKSDLSVKKSEPNHTYAPQTGTANDGLLLYVVSFILASTTLCIIVLYRKFAK